VLLIVLAVMGAAPLVFDAPGRAFFLDDVDFGFDFASLASLVREGISARF